MYYYFPQTYFPLDKILLENTYMYISSFIVCKFGMNLYLSCEELNPHFLVCLPAVLVLPVLISIINSAVRFSQT